MTALAPGMGMGSANAAVGPAGAGRFIVPAAALGPGMGSANAIGPARGGRFVVAAAALGPGMGVG